MLLGHDKVAELLIQNGANVNILAENINGDTALIRFAANGEGWFYIFQQENYDHWSFCCSKHFPLFTFLILLIGFDRIVQMIVDKEANVNTVNNEKKSALHYAAENGNNLPNLYCKVSTSNIDLRKEEFLKIFCRSDAAIQ